MELYTASEEELFPRYRLHKFDPSVFQYGFELTTDQVDWIVKIESDFRAVQRFLEEKLDKAILDSRPKPPVKARDN